MKPGDKFNIRGYDVEATINSVHDPQQPMRIVVLCNNSSRFLVAHRSQEEDENPNQYVLLGSFNYSHAVGMDEEDYKEVMFQYKRALQMAVRTAMGE